MISSGKRKKEKKERMKGKQEIAGWRKNGKKWERKRAYNGCRVRGRESITVQRCYWYKSNYSALNKLCSFFYKKFF